MADYDFDGAAIQNFLDPLFSYLSTVLPAPIYSIVEALITHTLTLLSALLNFALALATAQNWDAQKILPPLITLLAAYLALVSFYRTTGWMIRTAFWFVKWGGILVALSAGAGYFLANAGIDGGNNGVGAFNGNLLSFFGNALLGLFDNEDSQSGRTRPARSSRSRTGPNTRSQTKKHKEKERPKAWESWDKQRDWRHTAEAAGRDDAARMNEGVQEAVQKVTGLVRDALGTGWWEVVKNASVSRVYLCNLPHIFIQVRVCGLGPPVSPSRNASCFRRCSFMPLSRVESAVSDQLKPSLQHSR